MDFTLHNAPQSTCSQRVRYTLHAKGIPFDEVKMDLFSGDQIMAQAKEDDYALRTFIHALAQSRAFRLK